MLGRWFIGFFLLAITQTPFAHKCEQSKLSKILPSPQIDEIKPFERRFRQASRLTNAPIRIHLDSSQLRLGGQERENIIRIMGELLLRTKIKKSNLEIYIKIFCFLYNFH